MNTEDNTELNEFSKNTWTVLAICAAIVFAAMSYAAWTLLESIVPSGGQRFAIISLSWCTTIGFFALLANRYFNRVSAASELTPSSEQ